MILIKHQRPDQTIPEIGIFLSLLGGANGAEFFLWNRFQTGSEDFRFRLTLLAPCLEVVVSRGQPVPNVIKLFISVIYDCLK